MSLPHDRLNIMHILSDHDTQWIAHAFATLILQSGLFGVQNDENILEGDDMITLSKHQRDAIQGLFQMLAQGSRIPPIGLFEIHDEKVVDVNEELGGGFYQPVMTEHCKLVQMLRFRDVHGNEVSGETRCRAHQCHMADLHHYNQDGSRREFSSLCYTGMHNEAVFIEDRGQIRAVFLLGQMRLADAGEEQEARQMHTNAMNEAVASQQEKHAILAAMENQDVPHMTRADLDALKRALRQIGTMLFAISNEHDLLQYYAQISNTLLSNRLRDLAGVLPNVSANHPQPLPLKVTQSIEELKSSIASLEQLLNMMKELTEDYHFQSTPLEAVFRRCIELFKPSARHRFIEISRPRYFSPVNSATEIELSFPHFVCAIESLLDNAVKYSYDGYRDRRNYIRTKVMHDDEADRCVISINNLGLQITPEEQQQQKIFRTYYRGEAVERVADSKPGKGLGLAIAQEIISVHGGSIQVSSDLVETARAFGGDRPAYSTTFTLSIPYHHRK
jgi:signal transduction histidine kinase